jgi:hypothetical protein
MAGSCRGKRSQHAGKRLQRELPHRHHAMRRPIGAAAAENTMIHPAGCAGVPREGD